MMPLIITRCVLSREFQLVLGIDKKTAEADDLISIHQAAFDSRVEFALHPGLDLDRSILAALALDVNDAFVSFLANGFVRNGKEFAPHRHNLDDVIQPCWMSGARQRDFNVYAALPRTNFR